MCFALRFNAGGDLKRLRRYANLYSVSVVKKTFSKIVSFHIQLIKHSKARIFIMQPSIERCLFTHWLN